MCHYTTGSNHAFISYCDSRQNTDTGSNPYIIADADWFCIFKSGSTFLSVKWMSCCIESAIRSDKNIVPKYNLCLIENDTIDIHEEIFPDFNIISIVTVEWRQYFYIIPCFTKDDFYKRIPILIH